MDNGKRLIDANALLEKLRKNRKPGYGYAIATVGEITTVDAVEVVHGRWIDTPDEMTKYKCDNPKCGFPSFVPWNYCPNCGAKMDLEDKK